MQKLNKIEQLFEEMQPFNYEYFFFLFSVDRELAQLIKKSFISGKVFHVLRNDFFPCNLAQYHPTKSMKMQKAYAFL